MNVAVLAFEPQGVCPTGSQEAKEEERLILIQTY